MRSHRSSETLAERATRLARRRQRQSHGLGLVIRAGGVMVIAAVLMIAVYLLWMAAAALMAGVDMTMLIGTSWAPQAVEAPRFGILPLLLGSLVAAFIATAIAGPLAIMQAIYAHFFVALRVRRMVRASAQLMAAVPSVVIGAVFVLWAGPVLVNHMGVLVVLFSLLAITALPAMVLYRRHYRAVPVWLGREWLPIVLVLVIPLYGALLFGLATQLSQGFWPAGLVSFLDQRFGITVAQQGVMIAGLALGLGLAPTIYLLAEDALADVSRAQFYAAMALGATRWQAVIRIVIPVSLPALLAAIVFGFGRAIGETMIVLMVAGNAPQMPANWFESMASLASNLALEMPEAVPASDHYQVLVITAGLLFALSLIINIGIQRLRQRVAVPG